MDLGLKDKVAIVTGSGRGIGAEIARTLASEGLAMVVTDLDLASAEEVAREIQQAGGKSIAVRCDIRDKAQVEAMVQAGKEAFGGVDVLVNNAGLVKDRTLLKMDENDWDLVHDVVLKGTFHCCRAAVPLMLERKWGRIVNIASRAFLGSFGQTNYSSAKAGLVAFTRSLSYEQAKNGITVNAVAPGTIETEYLRSLPHFAESSKTFKERIPVQFMGDPSDIAWAVAYLASVKARFVTGETLFVTGGRYG